MLATELRKIATRWISLWCVPVDWNLFDQLHAEQFVDYSSAGRPAGKDGFAAGLREFADAFPDLHTRVEDLVVDVASSKVSVRWSAVGTNVKPYLGVGPTHKRISITGIEIIEIRSGQITNRWGEWDISAHYCPSNIVNC